MILQPLPDSPRVGVELQHQVHCRQALSFYHHPAGFGNLQAGKSSYSYTTLGNIIIHIRVREERTSPLSVRDRYCLVCFGLSVIGFQVVNTIKGKKLINL